MLTQSLIEQKRDEVVGLKVVSGPVEDSREESSDSWLIEAGYFDRSSSEGEELLGGRGDLIDVDAMDGHAEDMSEPPRSSCVQKRLPSA